MLTIEQIRSRLPSDLVTTPQRGTRNAAVAVVLRADDAGGAPDVLFIRRAERNGDPWSGHMAFPGGHADASDRDLIATAIRETAEEIGLDLSRDGELIGGFDGQEAAPAGRPIGMRVSPFVFALTSAARTPRLELSHEVASVVWGSLGSMLRGDNHAAQHRHGRNGYGSFPGYLLDDDHFVWGLTYRLLHTFFARVMPGWQSPDADR